MAFNGSGVFSRIYSWVTEQGLGNDIDATKFDAEMDGMATGLSNCMTRDGQSPPTASIPMNNQRLTGLGDATASTDGMNRRTADARYIVQSADGLDGPYGIAVSVSASDIDCQAGTYFYKTAVGGLTWTFTDPPSTGKAFGFILELTNGGLGAQTWPASVDWPNGTAPTLTSSGKDILAFITRDGGTIWHGGLVRRNSS